MLIDEELRTYLEVIWRHKWMIIACAGIALVVTLVISFQLTPLYSATAKLRLASAPIGSYDYAYFSSLTRLSNTFVEIATSDRSLDEVAERLGLDEQPELEVEIVPETELITISALDPDPDMARDLANTLANMMIEQGVQLYRSSAPTAREILESQLTQAKADLDEAVAAYDAALRNSVETPVSPEPGTPIPNVELGTLERLVSIRQQMYAELLQRYEETRLNEQVRENSLTIIESAGLPERPATPKVPLNAALGLVAGLVVGVILAFLFEALDDTVRSIEEVQAMTTLPILGQIPRRKRSLASIIHSSPSQDSSHLPMPGFDQLCARLLLSEGTPKPASYLITSPAPGAGKSTVTANLAISLVRADEGAVLIDMDFYRPTLHSIFDLPNRLGLSDYLCGKIKLEEAFQHPQRYPSLRIATAGSSLDGMTDWLAPGKIRTLLESFESNGEYVLIDSPAYLSIADPAVIASQVDAVILVVAQRESRRKQLQFAIQQLTELKATVSGIVLNKTPYSRLYSYYPEGIPKNIKLKTVTQQLKRPKRVRSEDTQQLAES